MIKKIIVKNPANNTQQEISVGQVEPMAAECVYIQDKDGDIDNGNLEICSPQGRKLNLVATGESIQIKPGLKDGTDIQTLQLDCEAGTIDCEEFPIKVCNGAKEKAVRVIGTKINTAELVLDTQNADTLNFDREAFDVKFRCDKWNSGVAQDGIGPIYAKMKGRAFDFRCYDHGGIAFQIAGHDNHGKENKIKFESDRTSELGVQGSYNGEGGKGLEFGTFNNEHASLYTGDYRFRKDAPVYAVTRGEVTMYDGDGDITTDPTLAEKYDYPTQTDDFKDIIDPEKVATWGQIITVAKDYAEGRISGGSGEGGINPSVLDAYLTKTGAEAIYAKKSEIPEGGAEIPEALSHISYSTKGNLEINMTDPTNQEAYDTYLAAKAAWDALSDEEKLTFPEPTPVELDYPNINITSEKISLRPMKDVEACGDIVIPFEISKKGKFSIGDKEIDSAVNGTSTVEDIAALLPKIRIHVDKNNIGEASGATKNPALAAALPTDSDMVSVSVYDLLKLVDRVSDLEERLAALEERLMN